MNMKLRTVDTPPYIYHGCYTQKMFWEEICIIDEFSTVNMKNIVIAMLGNTEISRVVTITSPWTSHWNLAVWKRFETHIQSQKIIREYQERYWLTLWVSIPNQVQRSTKRQGMPSKTLVRRIFHRLLGSLTSYLIWVVRGGGQNMSLLTVTFTHEYRLRSVWWELMSSTHTFTL